MQSQNNTSVINYATKYNKYSDFDDFFEDGSIDYRIDLEELCKSLIQNPPTQQEYTVYIPSKGRPKTGYTYKHCIQQNIPFKIVVEPQDYAAYLETVSASDLVQMPENDQGIQYARSFIKDYSTKIGELKHWQMDDDMKYFTIRKDNKNVRTDMLSCIAIVEYISKLYGNVAILGICNNAFAFSKKLAVQKNRLAHGVVLVDNTIPGSWRPATVEDWDFTLLALESKYCTLAFNHVNFFTPGSGQNEGGNNMTDWETIEKRKLFYENFVKLWPDFFTVREIKKDKSKQGYTMRSKSGFLNRYTQELELTHELKEILNQNI